MTDKQAQIFKVNTKPATGVVGGIYFVKSEKKTYIYSENGWEPYNNADEATHATNADKATTATKLSNKLTAGSKTYDGSAAVSLTKADLGLGNVDNTSDADKVVKSAKYDENGLEFTTKYIKNGTYIIPDEALDCPKIYISNINNGLAAANKWAIISITGTYTGNVSSLFDGNYDTPLTIPGNNTCTINIKFNEDCTETYPGYPYGTLYTMWYYGGIPSEISCRVYCNYEPHGIGWHTLNKVVNDRNIIGFNNSFYKISQIEFTITGNGLDTFTDGKYPTILTQIEYNLIRPALIQPQPILYKYKAETLYYPLTVPELIEGGTTISAKYASKSIETTVTNKVDKVSGKQLSTNDYTTAEKMKLTGIADGATRIIGVVVNGATKTAANGLLNIGTVLTTVDGTINAASNNPVSNSAVASALNGKVSKTGLMTINNQAITGGGNINVATEKVTLAYNPDDSYMTGEQYRNIFTDAYESGKIPNVELVYTAEGDYEVLSLKRIDKDDAYYHLYFSSSSIEDNINVYAYGVRVDVLREDDSTAADHDMNCTELQSTSFQSIAKDVVNKKDAAEICTTSTVNTTLTTATKNNFIIMPTVGTANFRLLSYPTDGYTLTFTIVGTATSFALNTASSTQPIYNVSNGATATRYTNPTATRCKIISTYSTALKQWITYRQSIA